MNPEVLKLLTAVKPDLDKARAMVDEVNAAIVKLNTTFAGDLVKLIPGASEAISVVVTASNVLCSIVNSIDTAVDAMTPPAA
jgi:hypothetical protein